MLQPGTIDNGLIHISELFSWARWESIASAEQGHLALIADADGVMQCCHSVAAADSLPAVNELNSGSCHGIHSDYKDWSVM